MVGAVACNPRIRTPGSCGKAAASRFEARHPQTAGSSPQRDQGRALEIQKLDAVAVLEIWSNAGHATATRAIVSRAKLASDGVERNIGIPARSGRPLRKAASQDGTEAAAGRQNFERSPPHREGPYLQSRNPGPPRGRPRSCVESAGRSSGNRVAQPGVSHRPGKRHFDRHSP